MRHLSHLRGFFEKALIPRCTPWDCGGRLGEAGLEGGEGGPWIRVVGIRDEHLKRLLQLQLDEGEAETIVLALEADADLVLLDDREARLHAKRLRLRVTGTLGVLLRAKKLGLIESLREELNKLKETGFRISKSLEEEILKAAGENRED